MNRSSPKFAKWITLAASVIAMGACNSSDATAPDTGLDLQFDQVDPVAVTFNSTFGLPDGPFALAGAMPFLGSLTLPNGLAVQRPTTFGVGAGVGLPLPDSLRLSAEQKTQIQALVTSFQTANKTDIDIMLVAHIAASDARRAGKSKAEVKAILDAAKPAADRVKANADALGVAIQAVLTPAQRAWITSHRPTNPFRMP